MTRGLTVALALLLALLATASLSAQYVAAEELASRTGTILQWDPYRLQGQFVRGIDLLSFTVDDGRVLTNLDRVEYVDPPRLADGRLEFGPDFVAATLRHFPPARRGRTIGAVFIDPGHGGRDPGAIGRQTRNGESLVLQEKDVVLAVSQRLAALLEARFPDKRIELSRSDDVYLTLEERTRAANAIQESTTESVVFVSIHANASLNRSADGFEVWFLPPTFRRGNLVDAETTGVEDPDVLTVLNTLREEEITLESVLLARNILTGIEAEVGDVSPNRGLREESWYVVRNARMPSVLVEVGFVTNAEEFSRLRQDDYLSRLARGIYTGITNFIRSFESVGTES